MTPAEPGEQPARDEPTEQAEPTAEPAGPVVRANVSMGTIEVDGMTINDLQCRIEGGGGLLGSMAAECNATLVIGALHHGVPDGR